MNWSSSTKSKCLVVIGDADPHSVNEYLGINWEEELKKCKDMQIKCFGV